MMNQHCPVCRCPSAIITSKFTSSNKTINCPVCAEYSISDHALTNLKLVNRDIRWKISAWVRQYSPNVLTTQELEVAIHARPPTTAQRANRMLRWLITRYPAGELFNVDNFFTYQSASDDGAVDVYFDAYETGFESLASIGWNRSAAEFRYMITEVLCNEFGHLKIDGNHECQISPKGLMHLEGSLETDSKIGFCAMWFSDEVKILWSDVIEPAIRDAGWEPLRIDGKQHNGKIDDEIMASIRSAKFVVADFTGNRGGVYYEAGFAHGLGLPVVFMCREGDDLHFDIRQYNCIFWKSDAVQVARERLKNRILATLGQGSMRLQ